MTELLGKVALVTGAGSGQGYATAIALAAAGAKVLAVDVDETGLDRLADENSAILTRRTDVTSFDDVAAAVAYAESELGGLDAALNAAGVLRIAPFEEITDADYDFQFNVNVRGTFNVCKAALPAMRRRGGGSIVNWGSANSMVAEPNSAIYCATKGAVLMLTRAIAVEYGAYDIRANCLCMSGVRTPMVSEFFGEEFLASKELQREYQPLGLVEPDEVAGVAKFLVSDDSRKMTGSAVMVDGGYTAR